MKREFWKNIENELYKIYPFVLITIGCMLFGYYLHEPFNFFNVILMLSSLCIAGFGGHNIDKRIKTNRR